MLDAVVVGSGPNGLAAAVELARHGLSVRVLEAKAEIGGGTRTAAVTLPGFLHDLGSAAHPMGVLSPYLRTLPLERHGLRWRYPAASVAHPLEGEEAVMLLPSLDATAAGLGPDERAWKRMFAPLLEDPHGLLSDALGPLRVPRRPLLLARFGWLAIRSARGLAESRFSGPRARALFAGCAAHAILPLETPLTAAMGLMFALTGQVVAWPVAEGGSASIARALKGLLLSLGGEIHTEHPVSSVQDLPESRVVLFDTDPRQLCSIAGDGLPARFRRRLGRYRYGPGVFKMDFALDGPIPWRDPQIRTASTVHLGGPLEEVAASEAAMGRGEVSERPFVLLVQQSEHDPTRAPKGQHTGYAYLHVPAGDDRDHHELLERRIESFAPGFKDRILARRHMTALDFERDNPNWVGGAITGGVSDLRQLFFRPVVQLDPYRTPNPRYFLCSASTPPGGGVHGMAGYFAARSALRRLGIRRRPTGRTG